MTNKYKSKTVDQKDEIYDLYLRRLNFINNWDLVDLSAPHIVGPHLLGKHKTNK